MSKIIGLDVGTKKVGIAISNEDKTLAFPVDVIDFSVVRKFIKDLSEKESISLVVVGESTRLDMTDNPVMEHIRAFVTKLEQDGLEVVYENEFMTSMQASRIQGYNKKQDASAAAIILQSYIDKQNK